MIQDFINNPIIRYLAPKPYWTVNIDGKKPLVHPKSADEEKIDIALREVAEGRLISEVDFDAIARAEDAKTKWEKHSALKNIFDDE